PQDTLVFLPKSTTLCSKTTKKRSSTISEAPKSAFPPRETHKPPDARALNPDETKAKESDIRTTGIGSRSSHSAGPTGIFGL
ncbi:unnamed protein product, partial [Musa hybrid cultivar]